MGRGGGEEERGGGGEEGRRKGRGEAGGVRSEGWVGRSEAGESRREAGGKAGGEAGGERFRSPASLRAPPAPAPRAQSPSRARPPSQTSRAPAPPGGPPPAAAASSAPRSAAAAALSAPPPPPPAPRPFPPARTPRWEPAARRRSAPGPTARACGGACGAVETADRSSMVPRRWTPSAVIGMREACSRAGGADATTWRCRRGGLGLE